MATKKKAQIATKGTLDMAYPPFILASTAAALGWEVVSQQHPKANIFVKPPGDYA